MMTQNLCNSKWYSGYRTAEYSREAVVCEGFQVLAIKNILFQDSAGTRNEKTRGAHRFFCDPPLLAPSNTPLHWLPVAAHIKFKHVIPTRWQGDLKPSLYPQAIIQPHTLTSAQHCCFGVFGLATLQQSGIWGGSMATWLSINKRMLIHLLFWLLFSFCAHMF